MKLLLRYTIIALLLTAVGSVQAAKYAGDAFALGVGARSLALGGATIAGPFDGTAAYWNPAGMNRLDGRHIAAMHAETFGSLLNHDYVAYIDARPPDTGLIHAFGFYLYYLGGGGIKITELDQFNRPYVVREESHGDYLLGASLSTKVWNKVDLGVSAKIIYRDIGTETGYGLTVDAGMLYRVKPFAQVGLMITDITSGFIRYSGKTFDSGGTTEAIYPTVKPGFMLSHSYRDFTGRFVASGDIKFEGIKNAAQYWQGEVSLDTHWGWELDYNGMVFGRAGFDIGRFTAGGGLLVKNIQVDFAYLDHDAFDETFRISAGYRF